ncbi:hypothetical protein CPC16_001961 [Podila verticillata]|nr:hypothetical protein CPC16_001961 [Podila verticillata]
MASDMIFHIKHAVWEVRDGQFVLQMMAKQGKKLECTCTVRARNFHVLLCHIDKDENFNRYSHFSFVVGGRIQTLNHIGKNTFAASRLGFDIGETSLHSVMGEEYFEFSLLLQSDFRKTIVKPGSACPKAHVGEVEYPPPVLINIKPEKVATPANNSLPDESDKGGDNSDSTSDDNEVAWTSTTGPAKPSLFEDSVKKLWMSTTVKSSNKVEKPNGNDTQACPPRLRTPPLSSRPPPGSGSALESSGLPPGLTGHPPGLSAPPLGLSRPSPVLTGPPRLSEPSPELTRPLPPGLTKIKTAQLESIREGSMVAIVHFYHYNSPTASGNVLVASSSALTGYPKIMNMIVQAKALQDCLFGQSKSPDSEILVNISFLPWRSFKVAMEYAHNRVLKVGVEDKTPDDDDLTELLSVSEVAARLDMSDLSKECAAFKPNL